MKQPTPESPFAALSSQEQKERWIVWQAQHDATRPIGVSLPDSRMQTPKEHQPETQHRPGTRETAARPHHAQYDAVVGRLNAARRRTGGFVSTVTQQPESTRQPSSGSE